MKNNYKSLVIVGNQWGDEGKGKITDYFSQKADAVVRFAGGDSAGHMIEFNNKRHKVTIKTLIIFLFIKLIDLFSNLFSTLDWIIIISINNSKWNNLFICFIS